MARLQYLALLSAQHHRRYSVAFSTIKWLLEILTAEMQRRGLPTVQVPPVEFTERRKSNVEDELAYRALRPPGSDRRR